MSLIAPVATAKSIYKGLKALFLVPTVRELKNLYGVLFIAAFVFLCTGAVQAAVYYVSPSGHDGSAGTITAPWITISKVNKEVKAGDTVYFRAGSYTDTSLEPLNSGDRDNYITFTSYNGEEAILGTGLNYGVDLGDKRYIKLTNLEIADTKVRWLESSGGGHIIVQDCVFKNNSDYSGLLLENSGYNQILNNKFSGCMGDSIYIRGDCPYNLISGNEITGTKHGAINIEGLKNSVPLRSNPRYSVIKHNILHSRLHHNLVLETDSHHNLVEDNAIYDTGWDDDHTDMPINKGLELMDAQLNIIRHNTIYNSSMWGMSCEDNDQRNTYGNKIYNNVFYRNGMFGFATEGFNLVHDNIFKNNIVAKNDYSNTDKKAAQLSIWPYDPSYLNLVENNVIFADEAGENTISWSNVTHTLSWAQTNHPTDFVSNIEADPQFVDPENADFRLKRNSPCIDNGTYLTRTKNAGRGTSMTVLDASYFTNGYGLIDGDVIQLTGQKQTARVVEIDYSNNILALDKSLTWIAGQGVNLAYSGSAPDIGAFEYTGDRTL